MSRLYGGNNTIHDTAYVDVETDADGKVVSVWFRCATLPFKQTIVSRERANEMERMYQMHGSVGIVAIEFES
jgi:hypothetical protein